MSFSTSGSLPAPIPSLFNDARLSFSSNHISSLSSSDIPFASSEYDAHNNFQLHVADIQAECLLLRQQNVALTAEKERLQENFRALLTRLSDKLETVHDGIIAPPGGTIHIHPLIITLDQSNFPGATYWFSGMWKGVEKGKRGVTRTDRPVKSNSRVENNAQLYITDESGGPVSGEVAQSMRTMARTVFQQLLTWGVAPRSWDQATHLASQYYIAVMEDAYNVLRLCFGHWKVTRMAIYYYPTWYSTYGPPPPTPAPPPPAPTPTPAPTPPTFPFAFTPEPEDSPSPPSTSTGKRPATASPASSSQPMTKKARGQADADVIIDRDQTQPTNRCQAPTTSIPEIVLPARAPCAQVPTSVPALASEVAPEPQQLAPPTEFRAHTPRPFVGNGEAELEYSPHGAQAEQGRIDADVHGEGGGDGGRARKSPEPVAFVDPLAHAVVPPSLPEHSRPSRNLSSFGSLAPTTTTPPSSILATPSTTPPTAPLPSASSPAITSSRSPTASASSTSSSRPAATAGPSSTGDGLPAWTGLPPGVPNKGHKIQPNKTSQTPRALCQVAFAKKFPKSTSDEFKYYWDKLVVSTPHEDVWLARASEAKKAQVTAAA
ncbi:uncharacterized protein SCHCODRAFT_02608701 [Schizophyllum commune H4-8]|uniref:uncharacterized protein n=1 Tax=Schizophyllum commune (strain H4-8 / FGSC 9210) TaxID=578458 RepID=UPI00215E9F55|nr:uncharacterized protein SCHCODRAFT_02608701 [Schizophyllum commune H4-8]KAI5900748.1 hypothetical protein SCHCODRAFT_02608701 [Schizophyllum commune H4-8]